MKQRSCLKNKSLAFQIWAVFSAVIVIFLFIIMLSSIYGLDKLLTNITFSIVESTQSEVMGNIMNHAYSGNQSEIIVANKDISKTTRHIIYSSASVNLNKTIVIDGKPSKELWNKVLSQYEKQTLESERYTYVIGNETVFYVIRKYSLQDKSGFVFSYIKDYYTKEISKQITIRFIIILIVAGILILLTAKAIASYLSRPIRMLKDNVEKIALKEWNSPVNLDREDEIGELSKSIEYMRQQLIKRDEAQQWMLQNVSHELKTPVMIIRSYAQSVEDGFFPKGTLSNTMQVIDSEAERLERKIKDLLYFTKLEYLSQHKKVDEAINIKKLIENVAEKFKIRRRDIEWYIDLTDSIFYGDSEQWKVALENILDNSLTYCKDQISIGSSEKEDFILIRIFNDGEAIEEPLLGEIFNQFSKGKKGKFGLGLAIVKQIIDSHGGSIWVQNEDSGVAFYIKVKKQSK